jgi:hypothetical protein
MEWSQMTFAQRMRTVWISLVYVGLVGFLGGYSYGICLDFWAKRPISNRVPDFTGPVFRTGFAAWGAFVVLLQSYRIIRSMNRKGEHRHWFWNLETWMQLKCLVLLMAIPTLVLAVRQIVP